MGTVMNTLSSPYDPAPGVCPCGAVFDERQDFGNCVICHTDICESCRDAHSCSNDACENTYCGSCSGLWLPVNGRCVVCINNDHAVQYWLFWKRQRQGRDDR